MRGFRSITQDDQWFVRRLGNANLRQVDTFWCGDMAGNGYWQLTPLEACFFDTMGQAQRQRKVLKALHPDENLVVEALEDCAPEVLALVDAVEQQAKKDGLWVKT